MYQEHPPPPHLARYVECFWTSEPDAAAGDHLVLPDACEDILFRGGSGDLVVVGAMTRARVHATEPRQSLCGVRFRPGMARAFLPARGHQLTDQILDASDVLGTRGAQLARRLSSAETTQERLRLFADALDPQGPEDTLVSRFAACGGEIPLGTLARHAGLSQRHLRRIFLDQAGMSPKLFARILRFRRAIQALPRAASLAGLALDHGYYDQSHMANEFREFSGRSPMAVFSKTRAVLRR